MPVEAVLALTIHDETVLTQAKAEFLGFFVLALFNHIVLKLNDEAAFNADHVVVMIAALQLKHGMAAFEVVTTHKASGFKLREYAVDRRQTNIILAI